MAKRYKEDEVKNNKKQEPKKQDNKAPLQSINKKGKRTKEDEIKLQKEIERKQREKEKKKNEAEKLIAKRENERRKKEQSNIKAKEKEMQKKEKERIKRIKQASNEKKKNSNFDKDTQIVIEMTNKARKQEERLKAQKKSKEQIKIEKARKKRVRIIKIVLLLIIVVAIIIFAMTSPIFHIKDIKVINNSQVASEEILSLSGLNKGENIFKFLDINVKNAIKENPYIEDIKVNRNLPDVVEIDVTERIKKFAVQLQTTYAYINSQGYILDLSQDTLGLPVLIGITTQDANAVPGARLETNDLRKLENAIKIMDVCKDNNIDSKVASIDFTDESDYIINMDEDGKKVYVGDASNLSNKMIYVQAILNETQDKEGEIFVNGDLNGKFKPYFREKVSL